MIGRAPESYIGAFDASAGGDNRLETRLACRAVSALKETQPIADSDGLNPVALAAPQVIKSAEPNILISCLEKRKQEAAAKKKQKSEKQPAEEKRKRPQEDAGSSRDAAKKQNTGTLPPELPAKNGPRWHC